MGAETTRMLQGAALVAVIVALVAATIASYRGAFDDTVAVTLVTDRAGSQLNPRSDVTVRGLVVGRVDTITTTGTADGARIRLLLDPQQVDRIPADVSARILPKTLFGEKFVELVYPSGTIPETVAQPIAAGAVIRTDTGPEAVELQAALDSLLPLLQTVEPQKLATTLSSVSMALEGRGTQVGETAVNLQRLVHGFNAGGLANLQADISELADLSGHLADSAPDLLDAADALTTTGRTVVERREDLHDLTVGLTGGADDLRHFLDENGDTVIGLADSAEPTLRSIARYSPEFPCLFSQLARGVDQINDAIRPDSDHPGVHITAELVVNRGRYVPDRDEPRYADDRGPRCYPQTLDQFQYPPDGPIRDGSLHPQAPADQPMGPPGRFGVEDYGTFDGTSSFCDPDVYAGAAGVPPAICAGTRGGMGIVNSVSEQQMVAELLGLATASPPAEIPGWSTVLVGPLLRGAEVSLT
ncbi:MAG: MCE family protein [Pseudonocardia sp.]